MPASLVRQFFSSNSPQENLRRRIDDHYHLQVIADNTNQVSEYLAEASRMQREAAIANLQGLAEIAQRQGEANSRLSNIASGMRNIYGAMLLQTQVLQEGFERVAQILLQQQRTLEQIADVLCRPYETKALEVLQEANRALKTGAKSTGRDQQAEFADATRLLKEVLTNPIGSRNYVAWFQTGWLKWKCELDLAEAEEAFYQASRLSAPQADLYHANSLRHMSYMQYLRGKYSDAYETIRKALEVSADDHDIRYDAARYAAKIGREAEAIELLEKCIDQEPQTIVTMFSEEDLMQIPAAIVALHVRKTEESRRKAQIEIETWPNVRELLSQGEVQAECKIILPGELRDLVLLPISDAVAEAQTVNHVTAVGLAKKIIGERAQVIDAASDALKHEIDMRKHNENAVLNQIQKALREKNHAVSEITDKALAEIGRLPTSGTSALFLTVGLVVLWIGGAVVIGEILAILDPASFGPSLNNQSESTQLVVLAVIFGWLVVCIVATILLGKWSQGRKGKIEQRKARDISLRESNLSQELIPVEEKLKVAKLQCQKAETALELFVANAQRFTP